MEGLPIFRLFCLMPWEGPEELKAKKLLPITNCVRIP